MTALLSAAARRLAAAVALFVFAAVPALPGQTVSGLPCNSRVSELPRLSHLVSQTGRLAPGEVTCYVLNLQRGELVRIAIDVETGYVRARALTPARSELQVTWTSSFATAAPSPRLAFGAPEAGLYFVELSVPTWVSFKNAQTFGVRVASRESAKARAARRRLLARDRRVASLRAHAQPLRTLDPDDTDFSDLEFLRRTLVDARVVFLGEGDNGGGSDVLAKTRLVKFLHEQMGFDVLAFQAGIRSADAAWDALQSGTNPRDALQKALFRLLAQSEQAESLVQYLAASSRGTQPLELAGFDSQLTGTAAATLLVDLRGFLANKAPNSVLMDTSALPSRVLAGVVEGRYGRNPASLPTASDQARAVRALRAAAASIDSTPDSVNALWAQVLRSTAAQADLTLNSLRGASANDYMVGLVRQMSDNLVWLVTRRYAERKVIVWAHTLHVMRAPDATSYARSVGYTVGDEVWKSLGPKSFTIALTSYDGASHWITQPDDYYQSVIPDQHVGDSFETLMAAAGHNAAFVNLRAARARNDWLGGRFVANALYLVPEEAEWSKALDAFLYIRTQEPRRKAAPSPANKE